MQHFPFHPAMGMAAMMPGTWTVPENPIRAGVVRYQPTLGEMMPGFFVVPQNPLLERSLCGLSGCRGTGRCSGPCGCRGCDVGLGDVLERPPFTLRTWWSGVKAGEFSSIAIGAAVLIGAIFLLRPGGRRR